MTAPLWTSADAAAATGGRATRPFDANGVVIDSRAVSPGDLFVALKGPHFDGHDFLDGAFATGAVAAMVDKSSPKLKPDQPLLLVDDTSAGLTALGAAARDRTGARIIAVTGSVGKTGTKEALRIALEPQGRVTASIGNLNNQIGVPLSLARMPRNTDFGIFELGMNKPGEIAQLSAVVRPHVAIITTIEAVHSEFFETLADIGGAGLALRKQSSGAIVNSASSAAFTSGPGMTSYAASKAALVAYTRSIANAQGRDGVRANAVAPGWVRTPMSEREMDDLARANGTTREEEFAALCGRITLRRVAEPSEIAACCRVPRSSRAGSERTRV